MNAEMKLLLLSGQRNLREIFSGKRPKCLKQFVLRVNMVNTYDLNVISNDLLKAAFERELPVSASERSCLGYNCWLF